MSPTCDCVFFYSATVNCAITLCYVVLDAVFELERFWSGGSQTLALRNAVPPGVEVRTRTKNGETTGFPAPQGLRRWGAVTRLLEVKLPGHKFALREGKVEPTKMVGSSRFKPESVGSGRFTKVCIGARRASAFSPSGQNLTLGTRRMSRDGEKQSLPEGPIAAGQPSRLGKVAL
jgi:hypothetical protein